MSEDGGIFEIQGVAKQKDPTFPNKGSPPEVHGRFIMGAKGNLLESNEVRVLSNESISLTSIPQHEDSNTVGVESKVVDLLLHLMDSVMIDLMQKLVTLSWGKIFIDHRDCTVFMHLRDSTADVDHLASTAVRATIFQEQVWWCKRGGINCKVCH